MELSQQVEHVVYWTNPLVSGGIFLVGLFAFFLVGLCDYSSISVVCYVLILNLTVRLGHMHGGRVLGEMNVLPKRPLPVPPDHFVTEEQVAAHVGAITARLNAVRQLSSPPRRPRPFPCPAPDPRAYASSHSLSSSHAGADTADRLRAALWRCYPCGTTDTRIAVRARRANPNPNPTLTLTLSSWARAMVQVGLGVGPP